jgi:hypothetical protein
MELSTALLQKATLRRRLSHKNSICRSGGGGAAERLHASCRHLVAPAEVERREPSEAAVPVRM